MPNTLYMVEEQFKNKDTVARTALGRWRRDDPLCRTSASGFHLYNLDGKRGAQLSRGASVTFAMKLIRW